MESFKFSFLFFLKVVCIFICIFPSQDCLAQQSLDSSTYYYNKIRYPEKVEDLPQGYLYYKKILPRYLTNHDTISAITSLHLIAIAEFEMGRIYDSETSITDALRLLDQISPKKRRSYTDEIGLYNHLGIVYRTLNQPETALKEYQKALEKATSTKDSITLTNNIANLNKDLGNYNKAIIQLTWAQEKSRTINDTLRLAQTTDNLGTIQSIVGHPNALQHLLQALEIRKNFNNNHLYTSYKHLSEHYFRISETNIAREYAALANTTAKNISAEYRKDALALQIKTGDNKLAKEYIRLNDSIAKAELKQRNTFALYLYNVEKEKERTQAAELAQEKERRSKSIFQIIGVSIVLLSVALFFILNYRHRKEKIEEVYHTESRISKKVHDEVANDLYQIMAKIQTLPSTNEALLDDLENVYHKTRDISKENSIIKTKEDFDEELTDLLQTYQNDRVNVLTHNFGQINWTSLNNEKKVTLYRVLQELMTNMRKHSNATLVVITAKQTGKTVQIKYTDNGVGCELKKGNGLLHTENRIRSVKGTIIFDSTVNKGFTAKITV